MKKFECDGCGNLMAIALTIAEVPEGGAKILKHKGEDLHVCADCLSSIEAQLELIARAK